MAIMNSTARTLAIINSWRGLPGEFYMLKGLLCLPGAINEGAKSLGLNTSAAFKEEQILDGLWDAITIAERCDQVRKEHLAAGAPDPSTVAVEG